ncbi:MAG: hypothetical protein M9944_09785 [Rhizobiaceae bacterium]|nr:hypothetical protein [Rhizobiaceae bacterium]
MASAAMAPGIICALRHKIAKIEGVLPERLEENRMETGRVVSRQAGQPVPSVFSTGAASFDAALGGGMSSSGMVEIHGAATREAGTTAGFALALAGMFRRDGLLIWIGTGEIFREAGRPYAPGLAQRFGIRPEDLLLAEAEKLADALWIAEEAANLTALAGILLEIRGNPHLLDLTATRRLHRRARMANHPLFLLRQAAQASPTASPLRLMVSPAPAASRLTLDGPLEGSIGPPAFNVSIDKSRTSPPATFTLEWNPEARRFEERNNVPSGRFQPAKNTGALAATSSHGTDLAPALRQAVAFKSAQEHAAPGHQPSREQYPAYSRTRRAR